MSTDERGTAGVPDRAAQAEVSSLLSRGRAAGALHADEPASAPADEPDSYNRRLMAAYEKTGAAGKSEQLDRMVTEARDELRLREAARTLRAARKG
jgi:hypothetical protein